VGRRPYSLLPGNFAICRLAADAAIPSWALRPAKFSSVCRTAEELSIVCAEEFVPPEIKAERGWACFKLKGPIPFFETGVLASFIQPLSENAIPIFAISTFDTDYVLIKEEFTERAAAVLRVAGHEMISQTG
jgi:hypothetical protein